MTHNITASGNFAENGTPTDLPPQVADEGVFGSNGWQQPVLTVTEGRRNFGSKVREVSFLFRGGVEAGIVVHPWDSDNYVPITGEDLFAFRELLNELPERAFKRPADPVEESFCVLDSDGDWWAVNPDGRWEFVLGSNGHHYGFGGPGAAQFVGSDDASFLAEINDTPRPVSPWEDGDTIVRVLDSGNTSITYVRVGGRWQRTVTHTGAGQRSYTDDLFQDDGQMDTLTAGPDSFYRVLRRGGKVVS